MKPDYDIEWLKSVGFTEEVVYSDYDTTVTELHYTSPPIGFDDCYYYIIKCDWHLWKWTIDETDCETSIKIPAPMTKEKVLEYIEFVIGMVNQ